MGVESSHHASCTGETRIYAEVHPDTVCYSVAACQFSVRGENRETIRVKARAEVPFAVLSDKPQLRECFIFCNLPGPGSDLEEVTIEDGDGEALVRWPVEVRPQTNYPHTFQLARAGTINLKRNGTIVAAGTKNAKI